MLKDLQLFTNSILIEIDFKQKILIGTSPRQVSGEFYNQEQRNLIGIVNLFYKVSLLKFKNIRSQFELAF